VKYELEEIGDFLVVHVMGNMTAKNNPGVIVDQVENYVAKGKVSKLLFNIENVNDIDVDGIDVFVSCLSLQSANAVDEDILWAQNLDDGKIESQIDREIARRASKNSFADEEEEEDGDGFPSIEEDMINLGEVYKESPNAPNTNCFILVSDDDVYDKLYSAGVLELMTIYRTREDFTHDQGVRLAE
jgi:hypothetical protein